MSEKLSKIAEQLFEDYLKWGVSPAVDVSGMGYIRRFKHGYEADRFRQLRILSTQTGSVMTKEQTEEYEQLGKRCETIHIDGRGELSLDPYGL
jgi:hypothetical protein